MRTPAGFDNRRSRLDSRRLPAGRAKRVHPPLTAIISRESLSESSGFFVCLIPQKASANLQAFLFA